MSKVVLEFIVKIMYFQEARTIKENLQFVESL